MIPRRRWGRALGGGGVLLAALVVLGQPAAALPGQEPSGEGGQQEQEEQREQGLAGRLEVGDEPVPGVTITVSDPQGEVVEEVETDDAGQWEVTGLEVGNYTVALDESTLPDGVTLADDVEAEVERSLRPGRTAQTIFRLSDGDDSGGGGRTFWDTFSQSAVNGVKFGLIIAMASVGLSLIFGTTGLINLAHGELVTFGAITAWFLNVTGLHIGETAIIPKMPLPLAAGGAIVVGALLGGALNSGVFQPLKRRGAAQVQLLVISIGLLLMLQRIDLIWFGSDSQRYRLNIQDAWNIGPVAITPRDLLIMLLAVVALGLVGAMLQWTRVGKAMRAIADNPDLAESSGVDVKKIVLLVWMLGAGLAAYGGVLQGATTSVNYLDGFRILLLMFAAVILGGLGTAFGAMAGGILIGLATEISTVWVDGELKFLFALLVLILVLLIRPQGLFGMRERVG